MPARFDQRRYNREIAKRYGELIEKGDLLLGATVTPNAEFLEYVDKKIAESVLTPAELLRSVCGNYPKITVNDALFRAELEGWHTPTIRPTLEEQAQLDYLSEEHNRMYVEMVNRQYGRQRRQELVMRQALLEGKWCVEVTPKGLNRLSLGPEGQIVRTFVEGSEPKPGVRGVDAGEAVVIYDSSQEKP
jgi:hypothetical protein